MVLGTLGYPSPEPAAGRTVDFRSDQLAFETIVYEMASGNALCTARPIRRR